MKKKWVAITICFSLILASIYAFGFGTRGRHFIVVPTKRALLIGVDKYPGLSAQYQLHGCVNDITLMRELLTSRGFQIENIIFLPNEKATKVGILAAFNSLIEASNAGDIVVIHFSGHGSQVVDMTGKELDGQSETLIPFDYVNKYEDARRTSLIDTEIDSLLKLLTEKTKRVTVVLDACHSSGATRNLTLLQPRFVEPLYSHKDSIFIEKAIAANKNSVSKRIDAPYTLVSGCRSDQLSNEYNPDINSSYGALTWFLVVELKKSAGQQKWPDVIENVKASVMNYYPDQTPQLGGDNSDSYVFSDNTYVNHQFVYISPGTSGKVEVAGGAAYGYAIGSIFNVYPPETNEFQKTKPIAKIELTEIAAFESQAKVIDGIVSARNSKAQEVTHNYRNTELKLMFIGNWIQHSDLKKAVLNLESVEEDKNNAQLVLILDDKSITITLAKDTARLLNRILIEDASENQNLVHVIENWRKWFHVLSIQNPKEGLKISASLSLVSSNRDLKDISERLYHPDYEFEDGDSVKLTISNESNAKIFIHVLDLQDDGIITSYTFGRLRREVTNDALPPNSSASVTIPVWVRTNRKSSLDVMKIYATTDGNVDFNLLSQNAITKPKNPEELLMSRGFGESKMSLDNWGTITKILLIKTK